MKFRIIVKLISLIFLYFRGIYGQCTIDITTDLNRASGGSAKEPLFLKYNNGHYNLMVPVDGKLNFKREENAIIACTTDNRPNNLVLNDKQSSTIFCTSGKKFKIGDNEFDVADFNECSNAITGNVINRNVQCGDNEGVVINIGFQLSDNRGFMNLIGVCFNKKIATPIYTIHTILGKTIKNSMKSSTRPSSFKTTEVPSKIPIASAYTKAKQLERFSEILGSEKAEEYLNKTFLARGHLTPDGDMVMVAWQWSTYYYINVVPQFQSINNGNWKHIESAIRTKAAQLQSDLTIFTGAYETLKLNNKKMTLERNALDIPKWTWKIVKDHESDSGIAFITFNNPFATTITKLCTDICDDYGWDWKERKTYSKGYTICCDVNEFMRKVDFIPSNANSTNILNK